MRSRWIAPVLLVMAVIPGVFAALRLESTAGAWVALAVVTGRSP